MTMRGNRSRGRRRATTAVAWVFVGLALVAASCVNTSRDGASPAAAATASTTGASSASPTADAGSPTPSEEPSLPQGAWDPDAVRLRLQPVTGGLESPLLVTTADDGTDRLFVVEQIGRIRIVEGGRLLPEPFLDIQDRLVSGGEQGLLGLAFHPEFASNGRFFVNYTDLGGDTVVSEFRVSGSDPDRADPTSERVLLGIDQPFANHNGGDLVFGPDGYLYIGTGDGGSGGDPFGNGQRLDTLLGKLLRIDVDDRSGGAPYGIPPDNPFVGRERRATRDLGVRAAQPVEVRLRPRDRRPVDRRRGPGQLGGDRPRRTRRRRRQLRLERDGGAGLLRAELGL